MAEREHHRAALPAGPGTAATLQSGLTVRQAARALNVPERSVYLARELLRTGREDLAARVQSGEIKLLDALRIAKPGKYAVRRDRLRELRNVWRLATKRARGLPRRSVGGAPCLSANACRIAAAPRS